LYKKLSWRVFNFIFIGFYPAIRFCRFIGEYRREQYKSLISLYCLKSFCSRRGMSAVVRTVCALEAKAHNIGY